jgi:hypothetical protein
MTEHTRKAALIGIAALCLFAACALEPFPAASGAAAGKTGRVVITIALPGKADDSAAASAAARTLLPAWVDLNYKLEFTPQGETVPALSQTVTTATAEQDLDPGVVYALKVAAYKTNPAVPAAEGSVTGITVQAEKTVNITAPLALKSADVGILHYDVTLSGEMTLAGGLLTLYPLSYSGDPISIDLDAEPGGDRQIPSGYYRARLSVYGSVDGAVKFIAKTEILHINDSLTTMVPYALSADDFIDTELTGDKLYIVENSTQLGSALNSIRDASETVFAVLVNADVSLAPYSLTDSGYSGKTIILRGNGGSREISLSSQGPLFTIGSGSLGPVVILRDITLKGIPNNNAALLKLNNGQLIMESGSAVIDNAAYYSYSSSTPNFSAFNSNGGGVYVAGGTFAMRDDASVSGNTASSASSASVCSCFGGGVFVLNGSFTMQDNALVSGNTVSASYSSNGGGVYVAGGTFDMQDDASVSGNMTSASSQGANGGGVYVMGGTLTIQGNASIRGNTAGSVSSSYGGGVYIANGTSLIMLGDASISGNTAASSSYSAGGGVFIKNGGTLTKTGGIIYGVNETGKDAGGMDLKNTAKTTGSAVRSDGNPVKWCENTVGKNRDLSTASNTNWEQVILGENSL